MKNIVLKRKYAAVILAAALAMTGCSAESSGLEMESTTDLAGESEASRDTGSEEKVLTLGTVYWGSEASNLAAIVREYNASNPEYPVQLVNYGPELEEAMSGDDYSAAAERFLMDFARGEGTDLIDLSEPLAGNGKEILGAKGILADLYELRSSEEWEKDYVGNILHCAQTGDKLYGVGSSFGIFTLLGSGDRLGSGAGWTIQEMLDAFEQNGKGPEALGGFFLDQSRIETLAGLCLDDYIDWNEGTACFETEEFYRLLEFARELEEVPLRSGHGKEIEAVRSGEQLASFEIVLNVFSWQKEKLIYGEAVAVKGAPSSSGTGVAIRFYNQLGINAASGKKEAALAFLDYYLRNSAGMNSFCLEKDGLERILADAMEESLDSEGKVSPKDWLEADGEYLPIYAAEQEDIDSVRNLLALADREDYRNEAVMNIIREEAEGYFAGAKSVEECASNINNRVQIYLDEQR